MSIKIRKMAVILTGAVAVVSVLFTSAFCVQAHAKDSAKNSTSGYGPLTTGLVYERLGDEISPEPDYKYQRTESKSAKGRKVLSRYTDLKGKELVSESTEYAPSGEFIRYTMNQRQIDEIGTMERKGDKILFTLKKSNGQGGYDVETKEEDLKKNTVSIDQMIEHLWANWDEILKGDDLEINFAVVSRKETIGFEMQKEEIIELPSGKEALVVRLTSGNFLIRLFVNPVFLTLEKDGLRRVLEVRGRLPIKRFEGADYGDIEGLLKLDHNAKDSSKGLASGG